MKKPHIISIENLVGKKIYRIASTTGENGKELVQTTEITKDGIINSIEVWKNTNGTQAPIQVYKGSLLTAIEIYNEIPY